MPYIAFTLCLLAISTAVFPVSSLGFELPKLVVVSLSALGASIALAFSKRRFVPMLLGSVLGRMLLAYMLVVALSALWSVAPVISVLGAAPRFQGILAMLCFCILAVATAVAFLSQRGSSALLFALVITNAVVVLYGTLQMLQLDPFASLWMSEAFLGRVFSTLGHPNTLGQFILLTAPFVTLAWIRSADRVVRMAWGTLLILNAVVLLGTVSRSAILGLIVVLCCTLPLLKRWVAQRIVRITTGQAFAIVLVTVLCTSIGLLFFAQRFALTSEPGRSASARGVIWSSTLRMIADRPVGYGPETMAIVSPQYTGKQLYAYESLSTTVDRAHNHVLHLLYALGPIGAFLFIAVACAVLIAAWKSRHHDAHGVLLAAVMAIIGYQVALLFGFPSNATAALYWMLIGLSIGSLPYQERTVPVWVNHVATLTFLGIAIVATVVSLQWMQSRIIVAHARIEQDPSVQLGLYQKAVVLFRYDRDILIEATEAHLFALEAVQSQRAELRTSIETLITLLSSATHNHDGFAPLLTAWLHAIEGNVQEAQKSLDEAKLFLPTSVTYHRAAMHIADLLADGVLKENHRMGIRGLLPDGFFEENSDMRRILLKQNPWLQTL